MANDFSAGAGTSTGSTGRTGAGTSTGGTGLMDTIREQASTRLSSQKDRAADGLGSIVEAVRQTGQQLREKNPALAGYADRAAEQLERFASDFRSRDVNALLDDVRTFAQRRPAVFLGSAVAIGMVAARFAKSSTPNGGSMRRTQPFARTGGRGEFGETRGRMGATRGLDIAADRSGSWPSSTSGAGGSLIEE
jgi:hypothetical protein